MSGSKSNKGKANIMRQPLFSKEERSPNISARDAKRNSKKENELLKHLEAAVFGDGENPSNAGSKVQTRSSQPSTPKQHTPTIPRQQIMGEVRFELFAHQRQLRQDIQYQEHNLNELAKIFEMQLPVMYSEDGSYISRLVHSREHRSLVLFIGNIQVGGVTFKTWEQYRYYEIAFFALSPYTQGQGYGAILMNHLKQLAKEEGIRHFLTFADNTAIGFFKKQGFSEKITIKYSQRRYVKVYSGATLMQCTVKGVKVDEHDWTPCSICSSYEITPFMICCDQCEAWCHGECVHLSEPVKGKWVCPACIEDGLDS